MPPVSAALGMAAAYYAYPVFLSFPRGMFILLGLFFLLTAAHSLLCVLRFFPGDKIPAHISRTGILVTAGVIGFSLGIAARRSVSDKPVFGLAPENISSVSGILMEDPRSLVGGSGLGVLELRECGADGGIRASARGRVTIFFPSESIPRLKEFGRGSEIYSDGILNSGSRGPLFRAASVHIVRSAPALETFRTGLRMTLLDKFQSRQGRTSVWGGLASALLLGVRDDLQADLADGFRNSGCSHILALSGMHLAILSGILAFLIRRPLGIRWASLIGAVFIVGYVFIAGSQPSLMRSAIMYLIGTFSIWGLLKAKPMSLLCMAFIIQLIIQSHTGLSLSFILSYLALAGILSLGQTIHSLLRGRMPEIISGSLSASLGAFIFTSSVVVFYFGGLRPIGLLAGLFLAPLSSLFMILALAALAAGFLPFPIWDLLDFVLGWFYRFLEFLVSLAGAVPEIPFSNPIPILVFSVLFWLAVVLIQRHDNLHRNSIDSFN